MTHRTAVVPVQLSAADHRRAHDAYYCAAGLWNRATYWVHAEWSAGRNPSKYDIQHFLTALDPAERPLHAHSTIAVAMDLHDAIATSRTNRSQGRRSRAPWRHKNYRPLSFTAGYGWRISVRNGTPKLRLSLGRGRAPLWVPVPEVCDPATGRPVSPAHWGEIHLCWDQDTRRHNLHVAYECAEVVPGDLGVVAAIDEGIINSMAVAVPTGVLGPKELPTSLSVLVVNGREGRSIRRRRNKAVGQLQRKLSRTNPGSRRHRKLTLAKKRVQGRAKQQLCDFDHQVSAKAAGFVRTAGAGRIVVGDVRGIEKNTNKKRRSSRSTRQQLSQWSRGRQEDYLAHKTGIDLTHIGEAYTSQTCPACNSRNRPSGRRYTCVSCGFTCHRDAVGAANIWRLAVLGGFVPLGPGFAIQVTYRRAVRRWSPDQCRAQARRSAQNRAISIPADVVSAAGASSAATSALTQELAELVEPMLVAA